MIWTERTFCGIPSRLAVHEPLYPLRSVSVYVERSRVGCSASPGTLRKGTPCVRFFKYRAGVSLHARNATSVSIGF